MNLEKLVASLELRDIMNTPVTTNTVIQRTVVKKDNNKFLKLRKIRIKRKVKEKENDLEFMKQLSESIDIMSNTLENKLESTIIPDSSKLYVVTNTQKKNSESLDLKKNDGELIFTVKQEYGKTSQGLPTQFKTFNSNEDEQKLNSLKDLLKKRLKKLKKTERKEIYLEAVERFSDEADEDYQFWQDEDSINFIKKELIGNQLDNPRTTMVELSRFCSLINFLNQLSKNILEEKKLSVKIVENKFFIKLIELKKSIHDYLKTKIKLIIKDINKSSLIDDKKSVSSSPNQLSSDKELLEQNNQSPEGSESNANENILQDLDISDLTKEEVENNLFLFFSTLLTLPRRLRLDYYKNYNSWINSYDENADGDFILSNRLLHYKELEIQPLLLSFLQKHDAEIYKKYIIHQNRNATDYSVAIKVTSAKLAKKSLIRNNNSSGNERYGILIIVPRFFEYEKINSKIIPSLNYSRYLETGYGIYNPPLYITKPISKKILFAKNRFFNQFVKPEKIFTTLYRKEYKHLYNEYYKQRKGNLQTQFFYKFRDDYIDSTKGIIIKEREVYINKLLKIVSKILDKIKTVNQLKMIKNFFIENSITDGVLEKTDLFINKVVRIKK